MSTLSERFPRCGATGKVRFPSATMASAELEFVAAERRAGIQRPDRVECRYYHCPLCMGYHLTAKTTWNEGNH